MRAIIHVTLLLAPLACERVVGLDLPEGPRRLVIEARLERVIGRVNGNQSITLTTTAPYFSDAPAPPATGAIVRVTDEDGAVVTFSEPSPGRYTTDRLTVRVGVEYRLTITHEGQTYEATEVAQSVAPIDSLYFDLPKPGRFSGTEGVRATIDLADPPGTGNFYLWDQFIDGVRVLGPDSSFKYRMVAMDDAVDGLTIRGFQPYEGIDIPVGSTVVMRQIGLSERMYLYYFAFSDQVSADGSPFAVPPASIRGNVSNVTNPSRFPLGYFHAAEVAEARATRSAGVLSTR
jgi:Domain of unknown function (DUF4249)